MKRWVFGFVVAVVGIGNAWGAIQYTVTDLGTLGGTRSTANDISAAGYVVGSAAVAQYSAHAFLYNGSVLQDLGVLGGFSSRALGISDNGQIVVGRSDVSSGYYHACLYDGGVMQDLGTLTEGFHYKSEARRVNNAGQVVGYSETQSGQRAFLYSNGVMQDLGTLGGNFGTQAYDINNDGVIVGYSGATGTSYYHAFLYDGTMHDLGTLHGSSTEWSEALAVNISGEVVGSASYSSRVHAFLYSGGVMHDIGALPGGDYSAATDINAFGQVVGWGYTAPALSNSHAFVYSGGEMKDLNDLIDSQLGWTLIEATAINDSGLIVGYGTNPSNQRRAFLLTPIPEPASLVIWSLLAGAAVTVGWTRRRKSA